MLAQTLACEEMKNARTVSSAKGLLLDLLNMELVLRERARASQVQFYFEKCSE